VKCWELHPPRGIVCNQDPWGERDKSRAMASLSTCDRPNCVRSAKRQVRIRTGEPGVFYPYRDATP
jgi:hypothetical protein